MGNDPPVYSSVQGPAKWAAVALLAGACGAGLTYSLMRQPSQVRAHPQPTPVAHTPQPIVHQPPPAPVVAPQPVAPQQPAPQPAPNTLIQATDSPAAQPEQAPAVQPPEPAPTPPTIPAPAVVSGKININTASAAELELLPQIGPALAKRIIDHRTLHGPFRTIAELDNVKGIGPKTLEKLTPLITVN
jgi:competence protein ComEA